MRNEDRQQWFKVKKQFLANCKETSCHYCGVKITDSNLSVDHKHPTSKGGDVFDLNNLALCCKFCNKLKTNYDYDFFVKNRENLIVELKLKREAFVARKKQLQQYHDLLKDKQIEKLFDGKELSFDEEVTIKKYRSTKVSLIRIKPNYIEFNFAETFPSEKEELLKEKFYFLLESYGNPVKAMKIYIDFDMTYIVFDMGFYVKISLETGVEEVISGKQAAQII